MRTAADVLRSLKRYVALSLGSEWEVRLTTELGTFHRPFARVIQVPSMEYVSESFAVMHVIASYQVVAYPAVKESPDASYMEALRVTELMWWAFGGPGVDRGRPARIPLYDYDGVPVNGASAAVNESKRDRRDFVKLEAPASVQTFQSPDDEYQWSIAADIRMSWVRSAALRSTQPITVGVGVEAGQNGNG